MTTFFFRSLNTCSPLSRCLSSAPPACSLHAYRSGYGQAENDPRYAAIEEFLAQRPPITVPTSVLLGQDDGINLFEPAMLAQQGDFTGAFTARAYAGIGHFMGN